MFEGGDMSSRPMEVGASISVQRVDITLPDGCRILMVEPTVLSSMSGAGAVLAEAKVPTCPDAIADWLVARSERIERVGMETGSWLWNELAVRQVPIICIDARHANGVLKMMPDKSDRQDALRRAPIVRSGWFKVENAWGHN
jgi:transposase